MKMDPAEVMVARRALAAIDDAVVLSSAEPIDRPGPCIVYVNAAFERMTGYSSAEVLGQTPRMLQGPRSSRKELDRLRGALERWQSCRVCVTNYRKDGTPVDVEFDVTPLANEVGWYTHWISIQRDVTARTLGVQVIESATDLDALIEGVGAEVALYTGATGCCWGVRDAAGGPWQIRDIPRTEGEGSATTPLLAGLLDALPPFAAPATVTAHEADGSTVRVLRAATTDRGEVAVALWRTTPGAWSLADELLPAVMPRWVQAYERRLVELDRARLQVELAQSVKLEAIGQLAGGIAHDLNNLLGIIVGNLDFLCDQTRDPVTGPPTELTVALDAADRARGFVDQLLAFSRRRPAAHEPVDLHDVIESSCDALRRTLGTKITVQTDSERGRSIILGDSMQIVQALLHLALNARDAMARPHEGVSDLGGVLTIAARPWTLTEIEAAAWSPLGPGACVELTVTDTGPGMTDDVRARAFEPFFTTKDVGQGSGLGLSTVFGTISKMGGVVRLDAAATRGLVVRMRFPAMGAPLPVRERPRRRVEPGTPRTVLLVEDEPGLRVLLSRMLIGAGHTVLAAANGVEALALFSSSNEEISVVVSDVRMPLMDGVTLVRELRLLRPEIAVLFVSGFADDAQRESLPADTRLVAKPFGRAQFLAAFEEAVADTVTP